MLVLVGALTTGAASRRRVRLEPSPPDRLLTADADPVGSQGDAPQRLFDLADLLHVASHFREVHIHQQIGEGLILQVVHPTGDVREALALAPREHLPGRLPQLAPSPAQDRFEARVVTDCGRARTAWGFDRRGSHGVKLSNRGARARSAACFSGRMGGGYSRGRGQHGGRSYGGEGTTGDYGYGARGEYGQSQFGGAEAPREDRQCEREGPQQYWARYFGSHAEQRGTGPNGKRRFDPQIHEDLCEALARRADLDTHDVSLLVTAGVVALEGTVPVRAMRYVIEDVVAAHPSVREVENRVRVRPRPR